MKYWHVVPALFLRDFEIAHPLHLWIDLVTWKSQKWSFSYKWGTRGNFGEQKVWGEHFIPSHCAMEGDGLCVPLWDGEFLKLVGRTLFSMLSGSLSTWAMASLLGSESSPGVTRHPSEISCYKNTQLLSVSHTGIGGCSRQLRVHTSPPCERTDDDLEFSLPHSVLRFRHCDCCYYFFGGDHKLSVC